MSRIGLAFSCFFRVLFKGQLPDAARPLLPAGDGRAAPGLPAAGASAATTSAPTAPSAPSERDGKANRHRDQAAQRDGALALLALLQREGRLIDFAGESLDAFSDADIGAAARDVHRGCKKVLDQCFTFEAVMPGQEDARVSVPKGFDPAEVRLIGEAKGEPPFGGTLRHHGWRATRAQLPALTDGLDRAVVAPAEVEV